MSRENKTRFALLGMLTLGPMSGYDLKKVFDASLRHFWAESYGQIYPILKRLVAQGWAIPKEDDQDGKPHRKVYAITPEGREAFQQWLKEEVSPPTQRLELLLKLYFGAEMPTAMSRNHLLRFREYAERTLAGYRRIEAQLTPLQGANPAAKYWLITLDFGIGYAEAALGWCDRTLKRLED